METESTNENIEIPSVLSSVRKERKKKSIVWNHFTVNENAGGRAKCNHCGKIYACDTLKNGTSSLKKHIRVCGTLLANQDVQQKTLGFENVANRGKQLSCFSTATCRELLAKMIIVDELPMNFVEGEGFRAYSQYVQPKFFIPSRATVSRDVSSLYEKEKMKLKEYFRTTSQRVCLTTDAWTSIQNLSYMVLTAHYIDNNWVMQKKILNFCLISNHKGETIGREVERCLFEWGIENVLTVTVDNASSNDVAISYLVKCIRNWNGLVLDGDYMHMRCFAHILNLIVCDDLKEHKGAICRIRRAVKYVRSSPARLQSFQNCVDNVKITCKSSVSLDVPTRWNSTYLMLAGAEKFEKAFDKLLETDINYLGDFTGDTPPTTSDWATIRELVKFLKIFYDTTVTVSASLHVTSNIYFSEVCNLQMVITEYAQCENPLLKNIAMGMKRKFEKYWGSCEKINYLMYVATVLDPRCKLQFLEHCFTLLVDHIKAADLLSQVRNVIDTLYLHYKTKLGLEMSTACGSKDVATSSSTRHSTSFTHNKLFETFCSRHNEVDVAKMKTEVDQYFSEELEQFSNNHNILDWWKVNSLKYPVLSKIARDILVIPISTVPSESAFSCGGRILDSFRSSLSPKTVEALICTQSWIHETPRFSNNIKLEVDDFDTDIASTVGGGDSESIRISD